VIVPPQAILELKVHDVDSHIQRNKRKGQW
jgi:hypothetical protein